MHTIGTLARPTGTKVQTIRYYEQIGLMPEPGRSAGGQRRYDDAQLDRLAFIRHARQLGFPLGAIRELLDLSDHPDRDRAAAAARGRHPDRPARSPAPRVAAHDHCVPRWNDL